MGNKILKKKNILLLLLVEILIILWAGSSWERNKLDVCYSGEDLVHEAGIYSLDLMGGGLYIDSTFGTAENFASTPGVDLARGTYQVVIEYEAEENGQTYSASSDNPGYWVVMGKKNVALDADRNIESFSIWMNRETNGYRIKINYNGSGYLLIKSIRIVQTNAYFGMHILFGLFALLLINVWYIANKKNFIKELSHKNKIVAASIFLCAFIASVPLLSSYLFSGHDLPFHLLRIEGIKDALRSGQFPVRIQPDWFQGYGYASSIFYGDIFLYIPAIIRLFGFPLQTAYKIYVVFINFATCIITYYCFKSMLRSEYAALIGSMLYVLSPYRLGNIYIRGAVGEYTAMAFFSLILAGLYLIMTDSEANREIRKGRLFLVLGFSGVLQCHIISCEMTGFFTLLVCILCIKRVLKRGRWKALVSGAAAVFVLNLWFLIPFISYTLQGRFGIVEANGTAQIQTYSAFTYQLFDFFPNAYGSAYSIYERMQNPTQMPLTTGFVLIGTIFVFIVYVWNYKKENVSQIKLGKLCIALAFLALWMSTTWFPWDALSRLGKIPSLLIGNLQYGWRMLSVASILLAGAAGCLLSIVERNEEKNTKRGIFALYCIFGILCCGWFLSSIMNNSTVNLCRDRSELNEDDVTSLEYIPKGTDRNGFSESLPIAGEGIVWENYENNHGRVRIICSNDREENGYITLPLLNYEGYTAEATDKGEKLTIENGDNNRIKVMLPPGFRGEIKVGFHEPLLWRLGCIISLLAIFMIIKEMRRQFYSKS